MSEELTQESISDDNILELIDEYIGTRIRIRRNLLGLTQEELAKALNVSFQQIQKYERGKNRISGSRMWHMARVLNVPVNYFFDGVEQSLTAKGIEITQYAGDILSDPLDEFNILTQSYGRQQEAKDLLNAYLNLGNDKLMNNFLSLIKLIAENKEQKKE